MGRKDSVLPPKLPSRKMAARLRFKGRAPRLSPHAPEVDKKRITQRLAPSAVSLCRKKRFDLPSWPERYHKPSAYRSNINIIVRIFQKSKSFSEKFTTISEGLLEVLLIFSLKYAILKS
jgi:hypothetical protein